MEEEDFRTKLAWETWLFQSNFRSPRVVPLLEVLHIDIRSVGTSMKCPLAYNHSTYIRVESSGGNPLVREVQSSGSSIRHSTVVQERYAHHSLGPTK